MTKKQASDVKLVIFDLEDVVISTWRTFVKSIGDMRSLDEEQLAEIRGGTVLKDFQYGRVTEDDFVGEIRWISETRASGEEIKAAIRASMAEIPGVRLILTQLRKKYRLALLTNFSNEWFGYVDGRYGISALFDEVFVSASTGLKKPNREAYEQVLNHFGVKPGEALFVDDKERNTAAAEAIGMPSITFISPIQLASELKKRIGFAVEKPMSIFRSYDVRGIYRLELDREVAFRLGRAFGTFIGSGKTVGVGRDYRNGSDDLHDAFCDGALSVGANLVDMERVPTPVFYFGVIEKGLDGGAMITASHSLPVWNGIKFCRKGGEMIGEGCGMERLRGIFERQGRDVEWRGKMSGRRSPKPYSAETRVVKGRRSMYRGVRSDYLEYVAGKMSLGKKLRVAIDPGNGAWCGLAKRAFEGVGCKVTEINGNPDGAFPARGPDPSELAVAGLQKAVKDQGADLGVAFDGDGDRVSFVDEKGGYLDGGNVTIPLFALFYSKEKPFRVVYDVPASDMIESVVKGLGGEAVVNRVGRVHMTNRMRKEGAALGGEVSNHIYLAENDYIDDGCFAALRLAEFLSKDGRKLSEVVATIPTRPGIPIEEIYCPDEAKAAVMGRILPRMQAAGFRKILQMDGIKAFADDGWVLVRQSNTLPQIKVNAEADTSDRAKHLFGIGKKIALEEISAVLSGQIVK